MKCSIVILNVKDEMVEDPEKSIDHLKPEQEKERKKRERDKKGELVRDTTLVWARN
jgi:hypothetical protein